MKGDKVVVRKGLLASMPKMSGEVTKFTDAECVVEENGKVIWRGMKIEFLKLWEYL